jgi:hypothetical protein
VRRGNRGREIGRCLAHGKDIFMFPCPRPSQFGHPTVEKEGFFQLSSRLCQGSVTELFRLFSGRCVT